MKSKVPYGLGNKEPNLAEAVSKFGQIARQGTSDLLQTLKTTFPDERMLQAIHEVESQIQNTHDPMKQLGFNLKRFTPLSSEPPIDVAKVALTNGAETKHNNFYPSPLPDHMQVIAKKLAVDFSEIPKGIACTTTNPDEKRKRVYSLSGRSRFVVEHKTAERDRQCCFIGCKERCSQKADHRLACADHRNKLISILATLPQDIRATGSGVYSMNITQAHDKLYGEVMYDLNRRLLIVEAMKDSQSYPSDVLDPLNEILKFMKAMIIVYRDRLNPWIDILYALLAFHTWIANVVDLAIRVLIEQMSPVLIQLLVNNVPFIQGYIAGYFGTAYAILGIILKVNLMILAAAFAIMLAVTALIITVAIVFFSITIIYYTGKYVWNWLNPPPVPDPPILVEVDDQMVVVAPAQFNNGAPFWYQ